MRSTATQALPKSLALEWVSMLRLRMAAMITLATAVGAVLGAGSVTNLSACFEAGLYGVSFAIGRGDCGSPLRVSS